MTQVMFNQFILYDISRWPLRAEYIIIIGTGHQEGTSLDGRAQNLGLLLVVLTDQRHFSSVTSLF